MKTISSNTSTESYCKTLYQASLTTVYSLGLTQENFQEQPLKKGETGELSEGSHESLEDKGAEEEKKEEAQNKKAR